MLSLRPILGLECATCKHVRSSGPVRDDALTWLAIAGAVDHYTACPACHEEVGEVTRHDPDYRRRVRIYIYYRYGSLVYTSYPCCFKKDIAK